MTIRLSRLRRSLPRLLALAACLLLAAPAAAATPKSPPANGVAKAQALVGAGRFAEALALLRPLAAGGEAPAEALFQIGLAAIGAAQRPGLAETARDALLDEAIAALRPMLVARPELLRVRLELARAFFLKQEDSLARRHFEQVLAGHPPPAVAQNVRRFLAVMRARKRWTVRVGAALAPDSNLSSQTEQGTILIDTPFGRLPFAYRADKPKSGVGVALWAGGEYQQPLAPRWRLRAGGDMLRREYRAGEFDRMQLSGYLGPRWLIDAASEASLLASARQGWMADERDSRDLGLRLEGRHRFNRRTTSRLSLSQHERRYADSSRLDGPVTDLSVSLAWRVAPTVRLDSGLGWARQRTERERERNIGRRAELGLTMQLPWGFTLGASGALNRTDYRGDWSPFVLDGGARSDLTRSLRLDIHNRGFTLGPFSPRVSMVQERRTSNAQLHDYKRLSGELRFVRQF